MKKALYLLSFIGLIMAFQPAHAGGGEAVALPHQHWHFSGMTGQLDKAAMQRGLKVYREVCSACHAMKRVAYRNLVDLGYTEDQVKNIAAEYTVIDGPDDEGEMFERAARPSDHFVSPYPNKKAAQYANNGAYPKELSLITKARKHGPDYIYALLTGYEEAPHGKELMTGQYWNKYFPGHVLAMAPPLSDGIVAYEDGSPETVEQYAHDVVNFLVWAADPYLEKRKRQGIAVLIFLIAFAGVMYAVKRKIWADVK